jgi:hypothetical protein
MAPSVILCTIASKIDAVNDWLQHHFDIGFDHAFIFDATNTLTEVPYPNWVTIHPLAPNAYQDLVRRLHKANAWCAFIDLDDRIVLDEHLTVRDLVIDLCPHASALVIGGSKIMAYLPDIDTIDAHTTVSLKRGTLIECNVAHINRSS